MEPYLMPIVWLGLCIVFSLVEAMTSAMVSCWFAIGALCALAAALFHTPLVLQVVFFAAGSLISFILIHRKVISLFRFQHTPDGAEVYLGKHGVVTEEIQPEKDGRIRIQGTDWKASAKVRIPKGTSVKTVGLKGVTMKVVPADPGKEN